MSLRDTLILFSDAINKAIDLLLDLPLWLWALALAAALLFEYVQNQFFLHKWKERDRINLLKKEKKQ